jgi:hypothetical protein
VLEPLALVGLDLDLGVQGKAIEGAAQIAGDEDRLELAVAAEAGNGAAAARPKCDDALDRGGAELMMRVFESMFCAASTAVRAANSSP